ncbi:type II secretion system protein [Vibrio fluvialis]|uniref:type II secretion system protein n=1 Tax=Vibrio fluvialis TaxID=676 RepID=UPI00399A2BAC
MKSMKKSGGFTVIEAVIVVGFIVMFLLFVFSKVPVLKFMYDSFIFSSQHAEVVSGVERWKKGRSNFDGVTIQKVCESGEIPPSTCGSANDGKATNQFGGDWVISANSGSKGLFDVTATIPEDGDRIANLADSLAPSSRGRCTEASGCSTISTTANSITTVH